VGDAGGAVGIAVGIAVFVAVAGGDGSDGADGTDRIEDAVVGGGFVGSAARPGNTARARAKAKAKAKTGRYGRDLMESEDVYKSRIGFMNRRVVDPHPAPRGVATLSRPTGEGLGVRVVHGEGGVGAGRGIEGGNSSGARRRRSARFWPVSTA
jgi:hypothetical protein